MAVGSRPFAYNTGAPISGTTQVGNLAVGTPDIGFEVTGLQWWNGPGEGSGWLIAKPVPLNNQDTPVPGDDLFLDPNFKGSDISLSNNNQTAEQIFSYQQSVLGQTLISGADKVMFSVRFTSTNVDVGVGSRVIGVGRQSMNYQGNPFDGYPGNDPESVGFSDSGFLYTSGSSSSGYPTWTSGDIIDIAFSGVSGNLWIRVNGGYWNNIPSANPSTNTDGTTIAISDFFPVLCPSIYGTMEVLNIPQYGYPSGFNFLGHTTASVAFLRSADFTDASFVELVNTHFNQSFSLSDPGAAHTWLNTNGYWTNR
jgi:hypothetical protein